MEDNPPSPRLPGKTVQKELHIHACELMHLRLEGKLRFEKKGNALLALVCDQCPPTFELCPILLPLTPPGSIKSKLPTEVMTE